MAALSAIPGFSNFRPTTDPFDPIDLYVNWNEHRIAIEIKVRKALYPEGQLLEDSKLCSLLAGYLRQEISAAYYCNVIDNKLYFWLIDGETLKLPQHSMELPKTTAAANGNVKKFYRLLPISAAHVLEI